MYEERLPLNAVILGSLSGGIALGTPFSPFLTPTWALLIGCLSGFLVAIWIKVTARLQRTNAQQSHAVLFLVSGGAALLRRVRLPRDAGFGTKT